MARRILLLKRPCFDGWVQEAGTFSTANNYLVNTSYGVQGRMRRDTANGDFQMKFSYRDTSPISGPWGQLRFRYVDGNNFGYLTLYPGSFSLSEKRAGTLVTLASGAWSTTSGDWYDVTLIADGSHIEVWRGPKDGAQTRMCSVDTATVLSGAASYLVVTTDGVYAFDDVQVSAEDLSATTYTYDAANQLTAMNVNGTTTNFTYDDWGRIVGKTQGSYAATYAYRFGDKLKAATSNFPGETASVGYNYDGLGRRRLEQRDNTTATWFRWSGSEECGEYAGTVGSWTIGALQTGYVPGLATFAGSNPATAEWRYHLTDHLGSVRQLSGQTKAALARYDYAPYGELMRSAGLPLTVGYTGHLWDNAIGQYYAPFRYYNPQTARWNMRDPLGFVDGPNVYAYVAGNPIIAKDRLGLDRSICFFGHAWIEVDTWDSAGNRTGSRVLNFAPEGAKDMTDRSKSPYPNWLKWTIPSTPQEDIFLLNTWRDVANARTEQWTPWNNCWGNVCAWSTIGIPDPPVWLPSKNTWIKSCTMPG
ncbi:MAG: RHS repeat-associated core domain-containing protein [Candidatus Hydrogenedentes bacterium]|nr:RHS repeat-associated core domain-containing protein [Candidatus Hydrogenedentota bacterium]